MKNFKNISKLLLVSLVAIAMTACSTSANNCEIDLSKLTKDATAILDGTAGIKAELVGADKLFSETVKENCKDIFKDGKVADKVKIEVKDLAVVAATGKEADVVTGLNGEAKILTVKALGQELVITAAATKTKDAKGKIVAKLGDKSVEKEGAAMAEKADDAAAIKNLNDIAFGACLDIENKAEGTAKLALACDAKDADVKTVAIETADADKALEVTGSAVADSTLTGTIIFSVEKEEKKAEDTK